MTLAVPSSDAPQRHLWLRRDPDFERGPVSGFVFETRDVQGVPMHMHERAQLIHMVRGVAVISTGSMTWTLPPNRAIWLPAGEMHDVRYPHTSEMRSLFFDTSELDAELPVTIQVYHLDTLSQELLREAATLDWDGDVGRVGRLTLELLFARLSGRAEPGASLPMGRDPRLRRAMDHIRANPARTCTLEELGRIALCSRRTLARLFSDETGMPPAQWRRQMRLQLALELLAVGRPVSRVAWDLGYASPGNFTVAFKRTFGTPPGRFFG